MEDQVRGEKHDNRKGEEERKKEEVEGGRREENKERRSDHLLFSSSFVLFLRSFPPSVSSCHFTLAACVLEETSSSSGSIQVDVFPTTDVVQ
jgi:hypothetical protein